jgi:hypothetical protein
MQLYMYRWPNGDLSFAYAANRLDAATDILDQWGDADPERLIVVKSSFGIDLRLNDRGEFELAEGFSEDFYMGRLGAQIDKEYPVLAAAQEELGDEISLNFEHWSQAAKDKIAAAVAAERQRVKYEKPAPTGDPAIDVIAESLNMHPAVARRIVAKDE